jgi:cob(I)alamin adenosyltransferase
MKLYTRTGDDGTTGLFSGARVSKDHPRIEAYGTVDELNTIIGLARTFLEQSPAPDDVKAILAGWLKALQHNLFNLGADLATRIEDRWATMPLIDQGDIDALEQLMDRLNEELPDLTSFVLPGGGPVNAFLHQARTVCRRAERITITLSREEPIGEFVVPYLNRLSDALFVWSRWVARILGESEWLWEPKS